MAKSLPALERDPEDLFADTRMSFGDHIEELRYHLWRAVIGFLIAMVVALLPPIGPFAMHVITKPVEDELQAFYKARDESQFKRLDNDKTNKVPPLHTRIDIYLPPLKNALGQKEGDETTDPFEAAKNDENPGNWLSLPAKINNPVEMAKAFSDIDRIVRPLQLSSFSLQEVFVVYIKVGLLVGLVLASPWVFFQIWAFVAAGLYPSEKRLVNVYLPVSIGLFLTGVLVCQFIALPQAIHALLWFNEWLGFKPELRLSEWLGFALLFPLVFGISFQTPLVMLFLHRIGIVDVAGYRSKRRISYFLMAVVAMLINPSVDAYSMLVLWAPMCVLYEIGIILCLFQPKPIEQDTDDEGGAMIGV